jgi:hypothetical protein
MRLCLQSSGRHLRRAALAQRSSTASKRHDRTSGGNAQSQAHLLLAVQMLRTSMWLPNARGQSSGSQTTSHLGCHWRSGWQL